MKKKMVKAENQKNPKRVRTPNLYYLSIEDVNLIIDAAKNLRDRLILKLLARTGIRRFELCNLRVQDVDFQYSKLYLATTKGGVPRSVPLDSDTLQEIKFYIGSRQYGKLIQSNRKSADGMDESGINEVVRKTAEKSGVKNPDPKKRHINPHIFRHSYVRHLIKSGYPQSYIQQFVGHTNIRTTIQMYGIAGFSDMQEKFNDISHTFYRKHQPKLKDQNEQKKP